jgi:DNA-binding response OmpR family regulator
MKKIMVIDDEKDLLALVKGYLTRAGYQAAVTTSCSEGLAILNSFMPDLIFMDINVGSEDGRVMCKQIKSQAEYKHIPIILISANDDALLTFNEYEANGILKKPFAPSQLLSLTAYHLTGGGG